MIQQFWREVWTWHRSLRPDVVNVASVPVLRFVNRFSSAQDLDTAGFDGTAILHKAYDTGIDNPYSSAP